MRVTVNGEERELEARATLGELIEAMGYGQRQVVAELNGEALERAAYASTVLRDGDRVEVVRAVAGG